MEILKPFILKDFDIKKPFSSFLPGLAGIKGIPLWAYYTNRGQGIMSVGSKDKNGSIIEFNPACIGYEKVTTQGFRTFIKIDGKLIEAFGTRTNNSNGIENSNIERTMYITGASFKIEEINKDAGYKIEVNYFGLPNMPIGALVRRVKLTSLKNQKIEIVDGTSQVLPQGVSNGAYKDCGNLMRSWMDVYYMEEKTPFYTMRASSADEAEVEEVVSGNFYLAKENNQLLNVICDLELIFGYDSSRTNPINLINNSFNDLIKQPQYVVNKIPCAFVGVEKELHENEVIEIDSLLGYLPKYELLQVSLEEVLNKDFFDRKEIEALSLIKDLTDDVKTETAYPLFDEYIRQSYLDNFLRGGYPVNLGDENNVIPYYIFSRKHGDPERDYNWFNLEPEYYSQGNGNFRDVNQNRRSDVIFNSFIKDTNIKQFMNLISLDGYNPLVINGSTFTLKNTIDKKYLSKEILGEVNNKFIDLLSSEFTPGGLINFFVKQNLKPLKSDEEVFKLVLNNSEEHLQAVFGEGYWIDHFTYNLDLIESFLWLYPEKEKELLFVDNSYRYFYNPVYVLPRSEKIGKTNKGTIRQYGSTSEISKEEKEQIGFNPYKSNWVKNKLGKIYQVNLATKLMHLALTKFTLRDPAGYGLMMEANKPGWNDAMNGLPGLLSSGVSESIELKRIIDYLVEVFTKYPQNELVLPLPAATLLFKTKKYLAAKNIHEMNEFEYYDYLQTAVEQYRKDIKLGIVTDELKYKAIDLVEILKMMQEEIKNKLEELESKYSIIPSYIAFDVTEYEELDEKTAYGLTKIKVKKYSPNPIPIFLEAPARLLKTKINNPLKLYKDIKKTGLYDEKLKVYRTSIDLNQESLEIGRIRAFTAGWLERESDFMHMTFKYLYGLLKSHLYNEFFDEIKTNFPSFMNPDVYGRSVFENSSFIATSVNPNPNIHGTGFVARLSGSNTEVVSMWLTMMFGYQPFINKEDGLHLQLIPVLPIDFFNKGIVKAMFLKSIEITYVNLTDKNTYDGLKPIKYELINGGAVKTINASMLDCQDTNDVRNKKYSQIKVYLG